MINWRIVKYKHIQDAKELLRAADDDACFSFIIGLVADWDFVDSDTGELLPVSNEALGELSIEQFETLTESFNREFRDAKLKRTTPPVQVGLRPRGQNFARTSRFTSIEPEPEPGPEPS